MPGSKGEVIPETKSTPNSNGVYTGKVTVNDMPKTGNNGVSSFFFRKNVCSRSSKFN